MKKLLFLLAICLSISFSFAQDSPAPDNGSAIENNLGPTRIESNKNQSGIGTFEQYNFTGIYSKNNGNIIGLLNDPSIGNYLFMGDTENGSFSGIKYFSSYNTLEITSPIRFYKSILLTTPILKIGQEDGQSAVIPLAGAPESSNSEVGTNGSCIMFDDNFIYIKTTSGKWKRAALFDVDF